MILQTFKHENEFVCLAENCPDNCCKEGELILESDVMARYQAESGPFGDELRRTLATARREACDGDVWYCLEADGRCPFLNDNGLCRIVLNLGEEALSDTCAFYPRFETETPEVIRRTLTLSCPEVVRLMLTCPENLSLVRKTELTESMLKKGGKMKVTGDSLISVEDALVRELQKPEMTFAKAFSEAAHIIGCEAQPLDDTSIISVINEKEALTDEWEAALSRLEGLSAGADDSTATGRDRDLRRVLLYYLVRYLPLALPESREHEDLFENVSFAGVLRYADIACRVCAAFEAQGIMPFENALRLWAKETELDEDMLLMLLEA
ncbi:MAG: flagellin lysine-N-methylase [Lachnospiraceae bacterium]|nr:flagellin lysine-N-methylase [Lachnospiraceae bacterium]